MIVYLDTSALAKLYVEEDGSKKVREWVDMAETAATSTVAYAEMASALKRMHLEERLWDEDLQEAWKSFVEDWKNYTKIWLSQELLDIASGMVFQHGLRGFDAIHLASAILLHYGNEDVVFGAFDKRLLNSKTP